MRRRSTGQVALFLGIALLGMIAGPARLQSAEQTQSARFEILEEFEGVAVQDRQTDLIWERHPSGASISWTSNSSASRIATSFIGRRF